LTLSPSPPAKLSGTPPDLRLCLLIDLNLILADFNLSKLTPGIIELYENRSGATLYSALGFDGQWYINWQYWAIIGAIIIVLYDFYCRYYAFSLSVIVSVDSSLVCGIFTNLICRKVARI